MESDGRKVTPEIIPVEELIALRNTKTKPISGLVIPHIFIPDHLSNKKKLSETADSLTVDIRYLFTSLTSENIATSKEKLKNIIAQKATSEKNIEDIADELLDCFLNGEAYIKNYMHLLNAICKACYLISEDQVSPTVKYFFLLKCKKRIFSFISVENIRKLAEMDQNSIDDLDIYNREREKIINLIITICALYEQRHTANIKLTVNQLFPLMNQILSYYRTLHKKMVELGDPYEGDCLDEDEYEILKKMCNLYGEHLFTFIKNAGREFLLDEDEVTLVSSTVSSSVSVSVSPATKVNSPKMKTMIEQFKNEVVPTLSEAYLIAKCNELSFLN